MQAMKKIKITSSSEISRTIYNHNGNHLLLFGKGILQNFEISCEQFLSLK